MFQSTIFFALIALVFAPEFAQASEVNKQTKRYAIAKNVDLVANEEKVYVLENPIPIKDHNDRLCFSISKSNSLRTEKVQNVIEQIFGQENYENESVWVQVPTFIIGHIEDSKSNKSHMRGKRYLRVHNIGGTNTHREKILSMCTTLLADINDVKKITFKTLYDFSAIEIFWTEFK